MGGSKTTTTQKNEINPELMSLYKQNYSTATNLANQPFTPYTGVQVAPFSPTQVAGQKSLLDVANSNIGSDLLSSAATGARSVMDYVPQQVSYTGNVSPSLVSSGSVTPDRVTAGTLPGVDLSKYTNPFLSDVLNSSLTDLERAREMQRVSDNQTATAAHAFGGSRQGVADSLTNDAYLRNVASTSANLRSGAYDRATTLAQSDLDRTLGANQFNATNALNAGQFNISQALQAALANQGAGLSSQEFNATNAYDAAKTNASNGLIGNNSRLSASSLLSGLFGQSLSQALQKAGVIEGVGQEQTAQDQARADAAYQEFLRSLAYPIQQQNLRNSALGMIPIEQTTTGTQKTNPGLMGILNGILGTAQTAAMFA